MSDEKAVACPVCGAPNQPTSRSCATCGIILAPGSAADQTDRVLKDLVAAGEASAAPPPSSDEPLDIDGEIVDDLLDSLRVEGQASEVVVECPMCGSQLAADAVRCEKCGTEFQEVTLEAAPAAEEVRAELATSGGPSDRPAKGKRPKGKKEHVSVAAVPSETELTSSRISGRLIDIVVGVTSAALVAVFVVFRLYSWSSLTEDLLPLALFGGIAAAGTVAGTVVFRLSTSYIAQGDRLVKGGRYADAVAFYDRAIRMGHRPSNAWTSRGVAMKRLGRFDEALRCQQMAVRIDPENEIAWCNQGDLYFRSEDFEQALRAYDKAIGIRPRYAIAWNNKGAALARTDRFEEARECHDRAVRLQPKYVVAWLNRGEVLARLGDREEAAKCLERARALGA